MREHNVLNSDKFLRELYERYDGAKFCCGCGCEIDKPEWHHIVPKKVGGSDLHSNIVPLCSSCHRAISFMKPVSEYRKMGNKPTGRKQCRPENCDVIFEDYVRSRIPRNVAAERLGKTVKFTEMRAFRDFKRHRGIAEYKNYISHRLFKPGYIELGEEIGYIIYADGRKETFCFGDEEPLSGAFKCKTKPEMTKIERPRNSDADLVWWANYKKKLAQDSIM